MHADHRPLGVVEQEGHFRRQQLPERIAQQPRLRPGQPTLDKLVATGNVRLRFQTRPDDPQHAGFVAVPGQLQTSGAAVPADDGQRQIALGHRGPHRKRIVKIGAFLVVTGVCAAQGIQRGGEGEALFKHRPQRTGHRQVFDDKVGIALHHRGDGGTDLPLGGRLLFIRHRLQRRRPGLADGDHVSVARKPLSQQSRHFQPATLRAHQDFGRAQAAGGQDHTARMHHKGRALATAQQFVSVLHHHLPTAAGLALQMLDAGTADHLGPGAPGLQQQPGVQRLLGFVIAAGGAVAAGHAGLVLPLRRADGLRIHRHLHPRGSRGVAAQGLEGLQPAGRMAVQPHDGVVPAGIAHAEQALGAVEPRAQVFLQKGARPARFAKALRRRTLHHPGIDQRSAAQAVGQGHTDVGTEPQIKQPFAATGRLGGAGHRHADMARQIGEAAGKGTRQVFTSPLQHHHRQRPALRITPSGERMGGGGSAITAAHDQHVHRRDSTRVPRGHPVLQRS